MHKYEKKVYSLLKMSKCELSLKVLQIANFVSQINHSAYFWEAFELGSQKISDLRFVSNILCFLTIICT